MVAGVFGLTGLAAAAMDVAQVLFWIAVIFAAVFPLLGFTFYKRFS